MVLPSDHSLSAGGAEFLLEDWQQIFVTRVKGKERLMGRYVRVVVVKCGGCGKMRVSGELTRYTTAFPFLESKYHSLKLALENEGFSPVSFFATQVNRATGQPPTGTEWTAINTQAKYGAGTELSLGN